MSDVGSHRARSDGSGGSGGGRSGDVGGDSGGEGSRVSGSEGDSEHADNNSRNERGHVFSPLALAERVHRKLALGDDETLPVAFHRSAMGCMLKLRDILVAMPCDADREVRLYLLYTGISVQRRIVLKGNTEEAEDLKVTLTLLYVLQVLCDCRSRMRVGEEGDDINNNGVATAQEPNESHESEFPDAPPKPVRGPDAEVLHKWNSAPLWERMIEAEANSGNANSWALALQLTPDIVCRACCAEGPRMGQGASLPSLSGIAEIFFRCSSLTLAYNLLGAAEVRNGREADFLTLDSVDFLCEANNRQEERLQAIVDAAETEAGQELIRDFILSFRLPAKVVGVRRTPLLSREASRIATEKHASDMQAAHEAAMRGAEWSWKHDQEELHKACALLAGLCIIFAGRGAGIDAIRKGDAFAGRVNLPFLETKGPLSGQKRLALIPHRNEWIVYTIDKNSQPRVHLKHTGMEGLRQGALLLTVKM